MAKKLDVTKPGSTGKAHGSKTPAIAHSHMSAKPSQGSAKVQGQPSAKLGKAYSLYKKFDY